jgi:hypothetical protein
MGKFVFFMIHSNKVDKVVEEYSNIFSSPTGVPLQCQVRHPIDLNLDASLANMLVYHHSLLENEEIKHQIEELLHKGDTSVLAHYLAGAQSCWYRRKMEPGESALITRP